MSEFEANSVNPYATNDVIERPHAVSFDPAFEGLSDRSVEQLYRQSCFATAGSILLFYLAVGAAFLIASAQLIGVLQILASLVAAAGVLVRAKRGRTLGISVCIVAFLTMGLGRIVACFALFA